MLFIVIVHEQVGGTRERVNPEKTNENSNEIIRRFAARNLINTLRVIPSFFYMYTWPVRMMLQFRHTFAIVALFFYFGARKVSALLAQNTKVIHLCEETSLITVRRFNKFLLLLLPSAFCFYFYFYELTSFGKLFGIL